MQTWDQSPFMAILSSNLIICHIQGYFHPLVVRENTMSSSRSVNSSLAHADKTSQAHQCPSIDNLEEAQRRFLGCFSTIC